MPNTPRVTLDDMINEIHRECSARRTVYTRLIREHRMNQRLADRRIEVMDAVLAYLQGQRAAESVRPQAGPAGGRSDIIE